MEGRWSSGPGLPRFLPLRRIFRIPPQSYRCKVTRLRLTLATMLAMAGVASAQAPKRALTQADWDIWKSISGSMITSDGKWAAYSIAPQVGDGDFVIRSTSGSSEYRVPRGYLGRPNNVPGGLRPRAGGNPEDEPSGPAIAAGQFTSDSKFALVLTYASKAEFDRVARDRRRAAQVQGRSDLAIVRLSDGNVTMVPRVRSFRLSRSDNAETYSAIPESPPLRSDWQLSILGLRMNVRRGPTSPSRGRGRFDNSPSRACSLRTPLSAP